MEPTVISHESSIIINNPRFSLIHDFANFHYILKVPIRFKYIVKIESFINTILIFNIQSYYYLKILPDY